MTKAELLQYCRYYDGTEDNRETDGESYLFWNSERAWVEWNLNERANREYLTLMLDFYDTAGLTNYETNDDTPKSLKALLFDRFCYGTLTPLKVLSESFKTFYKEHYRKERL